MNKMDDLSYRSYLIAAVVLLILMLIGLSLMFREKLPEQKEEAIEEIYLPGYPLYTQHVERMPVQLFFPDKDLHLRAENREIYKSEELANRLRQVLVLLVHGPRTGALFPVFPEGVRLRELYFYEGCVYVDLKISLSLKHNMGCFMEYLTLNAVQESLVKNFSEVEKVKILLNGQEGETLFGHIDTRKPFINIMTGELFETFDRDL
jgi:hypothetical protein